MRQRTLSILAGLVALAAISGCAGSPVPASQTPTAPDSATVVDSGMVGDRTASVELAPANDAGYLAQSLVHRWVDGDIFQYSVTLKVWNGTDFAALNPDLTLIVPRKGAGAKTSAVFTNLRQGSLYRAYVTAQGNSGGTAATQTLNATPGTADFDFTGNQDVNNSVSTTVSVVFDAVPFSGSATASIVAPADGAFQNPGSAETGTAQ